MNATINILCFKSKTLANGEHPLMICVCKDSKRKYISLGVSVASAAVLGFSEEQAEAQLSQQNHD